MANDLTATLADRFTTTGGEAASEVVAYDGFRYFVTNGAADRIDVFRAGGAVVGALDLGGLPGFAGVTSVAAKNGLVAAALDGGDLGGVPQRGHVALFDAETLSLINYVTVGFLPDSLTFSADGAEIYVANEGEPRAGGDAPGSVSIITFPDGFDRLADVTDVDFSAFDGQEDALRAQGVRIFPGVAASRDLEPEYLAIDPADGAILVTLQEANTVARIDRATLAVTLLPQGTVNHADLGSGIDASDRDGAIRIANWPVLGLRMADAVASFEVDGRSYYATANEGDSRDFDASRVKKLDLDPLAFPLADALREDANLGRLQVSNIDGDLDGDGDFDQLFSYGSRSFTIYDADGAVVFDSGDAFEKIIAARAPERFNSDDGDDSENRSDNKGPEPEAIAVGEVDGRMIAVIGLERDSGLMIYDVTDPADAAFLTYIDGFAAGDVSPEVVAFIPAAKSPSGFAQIAVAYEISGSTAVYDLTFTGEQVGEGEPKPFTLELLHFSDQEASTEAAFDAPRASAVFNALEAQDLGGDGLPDNTLRLSSGDAILPGLFFQASQAVFGQAGVADMIIQNELGLQAIGFGNHEFDVGAGFIADLIDGDFDDDGDPATPEAPLAYSVPGVPAYSGTNFPYLSANLFFPTQADLAPLEIAGGQAPQGGVVTSSTILETGGEMIGVVGATTPTLDFISSPGDLLVLPEEFDGAPTPAQLDALAALIQAEVDALIAANPSLNKVILLAHMQQITLEQELAARLSDVDIIVGGGSNTRLLDETDRLRDGDTKQGDYPIVVENAGGGDTLIVNTDGSYKYVGRLVIDFDADGNIIADSYDPAVSGAYATDAQGVADLGAEALIDPEIQAVADAIAAEIAAKESNVFGVSDVYLAGLRPEIRQQQTNLGDLTADANLAAARQADATVTVSIKNGGGIRDDIGRVFVPVGTEVVRLPNEEIRDADGAVIKPAGGVSQNDIANTLRFNNELSLLTLTTEQLRAVLEHGVAASTYDENGGTNTQGRFPQVAGVEFSFDPDLAPGARIVNARIVGDDGATVLEIVRDGATVDNGATPIRVVTLNFLAGGGDGYPFPQDAAADRVDLVTDGVTTGAATFADDFTEQDALAEYLAANFLTTPFAHADTPLGEDTRIQNLNFRADAVFEEVATPAIVLNEVLGSTTGADSEYVELFGAAGASLAGLSVIAVESDPGASRGAIDFRFDFAADAALGANGFFLLANAAAQATYGVTADATITDSLENSAYTLALVETASLSGAGVTGAETVLDTVAVDDGDGDFFFGAPVIGPDGPFLPAGVGRVADGVDTDAAADWRILSFDNATPPNTPTAGGAGDGGGAGETDVTLISQVQGDGAESPLDTLIVTVEAVVVGDFQDGDADDSRNLGGFFLQEEDADADGVALTSEGLFVFDRGGVLTDVALGDTVRVTGAVSEFFGETQLDPTAIEIVASGAPLPTAAQITLPAAAATLSQDGDAQPDLEAYEGMRVTFSDPLTITEQFNLDRFNEVRLVAGARPQQFTQTNAPDVAGFAAHLAEVGARTITYDDGLNAQNAAIGGLDGFGPVYDTASAPRMGDVIENLSGVLSYQWAGNPSSGATWRVRAASDGENAVTPANPRPETPDVGGALKVASFNVLNFFTTLDLSGATTINGLDPRGADSAAEFDRQLEKLVTAITALDADLLGLIELENDPAGDASLTALTGALNAELGAGTYQYLDTGVIGGDAIKVGFLYRPGALAPAGDFALLDNTVDPRFDSDNQRPTLAQTFESVADGAAFTATVSHFKSKGSPAGAPGDTNAGDGQGFSNGTRTQAAEALVDWLAGDPTGSGDADFLILGDLNSYAQEDPITAILSGADDVAGTDDDFVNLVARFGGEDAFSFVFDGQTGTLDYALASASLAAQVTGAAEWRINADEADALDYNLDFGRDPAIFDGAAPARASDHDPVLVGLDLDGGRGQTLTVIAGGDGDASRAPLFEVFVDGVSLGERTIAALQTAEERRVSGVLWESFEFALDAAPADSVEIVYLNDRGAQGDLADVNLFVDAIEIGDRRLEAEIDGYFEKAYAFGAETANGPREGLFWNGTLSFDGFAVV